MRNYDQTMTSEQARLKSGDSSLLDTILTEQQATSARLAYIAAQQEYASLLAQLRHEAGLLVQDGAVDGVAAGHGSPGPHSEVSDGRPPDDSPRSARIGSCPRWAAPAAAQEPAARRRADQRSPTACGRPLDKARIRPARARGRQRPAGDRSGRRAARSTRCCRSGRSSSIARTPSRTPRFFNPERVKRGFAARSPHRVREASPTLWGNISARAAAIFRSVQPMAPSAVTS